MDAPPQFSPEAREHLLFFLRNNEEGVRLALGVGYHQTVRDRHGNVVLADTGPHLYVYHADPDEDLVDLDIDGFTISMPASEYRELTGKRICLSTGNSSNPSVASGDILKIEEYKA